MVGKLRCNRTFCNLDLRKYLTFSWTCKTLQVSLYSKLPERLRCYRTFSNLELRNFSFGDSET